jgi:hypothetical protein
MFSGTMPMSAAVSKLPLLVFFVALLLEMDINVLRLHNCHDRIVCSGHAVHAFSFTGGLRGHGRHVRNWHYSADKILSSTQQQPLHQLSSSLSFDREKRLNVWNDSRLEELEPHEVAQETSPQMFIRPPKPRKSYIQSIATYNLAGVTSADENKHGDGSIQFDLDPNFVAVTGETGSGKSLLLRTACDLIAGKKAHPNILPKDGYGSKSQEPVRVNLGKDWVLYHMQGGGLLVRYFLIEAFHFYVSASGCLSD